MPESTAATDTARLDQWTEEIREVLTSEIPKAHPSEVIRDTLISRFWSVKTEELGGVRQELEQNNGGGLPTGPQQQLFVWLTPPSPEHCELCAAACQAVWNRLHTEPS